MPFKKPKELIKRWRMKIYIEPFNYYISRDLTKWFGCHVASQASGSGITFTPLGTEPVSGKKIRSVVKKLKKLPWVTVVRIV